MLAFITGSGLYNHQLLQATECSTPFGQATLLYGEVNGREILMLPRHGAGHQFLPHQINHRANLWALKHSGATAVISCSVCGILNSGWELGTPLLARDIYYPSNCLGDGSCCSIFQDPGEAGRGHLLAASLLHPELSQAVLSLADTCKEGSYGQVQGPRFNTPCEIRALQQTGVDFISQTCGPEAVLANELELPYALAAFGIDYANGVCQDPTPVDVLQANLEKSGNWFKKVMEELMEPDEGFAFGNYIYRFD